MAELTDTSDSTLLFKGPCEKCGSSDANATYSDGHKFCFSCQELTPGGDGVSGAQAPRRGVPGLLVGEDFTTGLPGRCLTAETLAHFRYQAGTYRGEPVQIAPYYDGDGRLIAQHLRTADKNFPWVGDPKKALPFGSQCWPKTGRMLVVTEGEIDAMSFSQVQGNKYPVVGLGCGASAVKKYIATHRDYFLGFEKVVLMLDNDEPGREATIGACEVLGLRAYIAELPLKDANEMLQEGRVKEMIDAMWRAKQYRPDGILELQGLKASFMGGVAWGLPWPWPTLTRLTFGRRTGEVYTFGAGTGQGKSDLLAEVIAQTITELKEPVGAFLLEQHPSESLKRIGGKMVNKRLHIPEAGWDETDLLKAWEMFEGAAPIHFYDSFGITEWDTIRERIRYMRHALGVRHIFLDHLTALASGIEDERVELERIMSEIGKIVKELDICIYLVSHLSTPDGKPHEEGGRVMLRHLKGSRSIPFWSHFVFALERDQQAEDELERHTSTFRILKDRYTGQATGNTFPLRYDHVTGRLLEPPIGGFSATDTAPAPAGASHF